MTKNINNSEYVDINDYQSTDKENHHPNQTEDMLGQFESACRQIKKSKQENEQNKII